MGSTTFQLRGLDKLQAKLQRIAKLEEVEQIIEENGANMQKKAVDNASKFKGQPDT